MDTQYIFVQSLLVSLFLLLNFLRTLMIDASYFTIIICLLLFWMFLHLMSCYPLFFLFHYVYCFFSLLVLYMILPLAYEHNVLNFYEYWIYYFSLIVLIEKYHQCMHLKSTTQVHNVVLRCQQELSSVACIPTIYQNLDQIMFGYLLWNTRMNSRVNCMHWTLIGLYSVIMLLSEVSELLFCDGIIFLFLNHLFPRE